MKKVKKCKIGDKVFAKIKGYPAWPAEVINDKGKKLSVKFYGTGEMGFVRPEDTYPYLQYKSQFSKPSKKKEFNDALHEIELVVEQCGGDGSIPLETTNDLSESNETAVTSDKKASRKRPPSPVKDAATNDDEVATKKIMLEEPTIPAADNDDISEVPPKQPTTVEQISNDETQSLSERNDTKNEEFNESEKSQLVTDDDAVVPNVEESSAVDESSESVESTEFTLVSDEDLDYCQLYYEHVQKNPTVYRSNPMEVRVFNAKDVLAVPSKGSGTHYLGLKVHLNWPIAKSQNEFEAAKYDAENATRLLALKDEVADGRTTVDSHSELFHASFKMTESEVRAEIQKYVVERKVNRMQRLQRERDLVTLDMKIKNCLGLDKANTSDALVLMDELLTANIDEIMLKKHSHVVEMVKKLKNYVGNTEQWAFDERQLEEFNVNAEKIRKKAEAIIDKFKKVVKLPNESINFWHGFNEALRKFVDNCKHLSKRDCFLLCAEPNSRQAFFDMLETTDESHEFSMTDDTQK